MLINISKKKIITYFLNLNNTLTHKLKHCVQIQNFLVIDKTQRRKPEYLQIIKGMNKTV